MSIIRGIVAAGAALLASSAGIQAADLGGYGVRGSIKDGPVPAYTHGCPSWYARVDGGYASFDRPAMSEIGIDDYQRARIESTWSVGGGFGHYFTCNVRGDITVDHRFESKVTGMNANPNAPVYGTHKWGYESTAIMFNAYYDFDTRARFTPYIGVGLGLAHNQFIRGTGVVGNGVIGGVPGTAIVIGGNDSWHAAAALMAGFTVPLRERLTLDAGYRFLYLGDNRTGQIRETAFNGLGGPTRVEELHSHEFRLGLRYDIR